MSRTNRMHIVDGNFYWTYYLKVSPSVVASIKYKKFLHFYADIDYTFNVVRNGCCNEMERLEIVWIFKLQQRMQHNCTY